MTEHHIRVLLAALAICAPLPAIASSPLSLWDPETALTVPPDPAVVCWPELVRVLVVAANGERHLVYHVERPRYRPQVYYKRFVPGNGWLPETCITRDRGSPYTNGNPSIGLDPGCNLHVGWLDGGCWFAYYMMRNSAGVWDSVSTMLSNSNGAIRRGPVGMVCTPDGHVHAMWNEFHPLEGWWLVYREKVGDTWGPAYTVDSTGADTIRWPYVDAPCMVAGPNSSVHLTYVGGRLPGGPPADQIYYRRRSGGVWSERERVSLGRDDRDQMGSAVALNPLTGEPHVVWMGRRPDTGTTYILHSQRTGNGWLPPQLISDSLDRPDQSGPSIVITPDGIVHVSWRSFKKAGSVANIVYRQRNPSGWWQPPVDLTSDSVRRFYAGLADGGPGPDSNHIHLVWTDPRSGVDEVYYRHGAPSPSGIKWDEEEPLGAARAQTLGATVCRGILRLTADSRQLTASRLELLDVAGRVVLTRPLDRSTAGPLSVDVSHLSPGIYFVREGGLVDQGNRGTKVMKIVLAR